jgi:hypothetical protein
MTTAAQETAGVGHARYTFRLRVSSTATGALEAEWARCRWLWNECCARSKKAHAENEKCGPARLDKMLTEARACMGWLREGSSVPQQQVIRDFAKSRAKALKDIKAAVPMRQRAGMPQYKKKHQDELSLNYTQRGFSAQGRPPAPGGRHRRDGRVVACSFQASLQRPGRPRQHGGLVRVFRRPEHDRDAAGNRPGDRDRLGCEGDCDHHQ